MSATITPPRLITAEEYAAMSDDGRRTELVRGEVIELPPPSSMHGIVCTRIARRIGAFVEDNNLGQTTVESGTVTETDPDTIRGPDVCFYRADRVPNPIPETGYIAAVPNLVFEVLSPSNRWIEVHRKIAEYLNAGVDVVCVVVLPDRTVQVYRRDRPPQTFAADAELTLPDVLPGFACGVAAFFP
jgi:Uma2 family endonuclease